MIAGPAVRVLVVDGQVSRAAALSAVLALDGWQVEVAADAAAAMAAIGRHAPDLVLADVELPGQGGVALCRQIKHTRATRLVPVVIVGRDAGAHRLAAFEAGADEVLAAPLDIEHLRARVRALARVKRFTDELDSAESVILSLARTVEARDPYTEGHCERLAAYAAALGAALGLADDDLAALRRGGYLHDVGKIGIADAVLLKGGQLTASEYDAVKQHPAIGERLLGDLRTLAPLRSIIRHHHERLDGSGYPDRLGGAEVPLLAHVVSIVDAYDAMVTERPYRSARSKEVACAELRADAARGVISRDLVETFIARVVGEPRVSAGPT